MDCQEAQESILDEFEEPRATDRRLAVEIHIVSCETCRRFAKLQRVLDQRLAAAMPMACLRPGFRKAVTERIHNDPVTTWPDFLPDVAHIFGCALAIVLMLFLLPRHSETIVLTGAAFTAVTYFLQAAIRSSLDTLEGDA
jgi:hypothetical protein